MVCLWTRRPENTFSILIVNDHIVQQKKYMPSKATINWLFNDIWCYLFIACFDSIDSYNGLLYP